MGKFQIQIASYLSPQKIHHNFEFVFHKFICINGNNVHSSWNTKITSMQCRQFFIAISSYQWNIINIEILISVFINKSFKQQQ